MTLKSWIQNRLSQPGINPTHDSYPQRHRHLAVDCNGRTITLQMQTILQHQYEIGARCREEMEDAAKVCCRILGTPDEANSSVHDFAVGIVYDQTTPLKAINQINRHLEQEALVS